MNQDLEASYAHCRRIARRSGSNFCFAFLLLPGPQRRAMYALYAYLRRTDDLGDSPQPVEVRREALARWRASLHAAIEGRFDDPVFPALVDTVRRYHIPLEHLDAVIDGVAMDLEEVRFETFDDLAGYCRRVASAVGLACLPIWGARGEEAYEPATKCGIAFQLTNILRDLAEDARGGRIYLPQEDLRRFGYSAADLARGTVNDRFRALVAFEIERAEGFYREGAALTPWLEPAGRRIFGAMFETYHGLLKKIEHHAPDLLVRRVRLGRWRKLRIAARWLLWPPAPGQSL
jgi:15-cis-phytoene synthase